MDVVESLSSLSCPLVSLRDAWWQRWGSERCSGLRVRGSVPQRVPYHGSARPRPCATVSRASSVSMSYAPGRSQEGTGGLSCVCLNYNQGMEHTKTVDFHSSYCTRKSCTVSYLSHMIIAKSVLHFEFCSCSHLKLHAVRHKNTVWLCSSFVSVFKRIFSRSRVGHWQLSKRGYGNFSSHIYLFIFYLASTAVVKLGFWNWKCGWQKLVRNCNVREYS